MSEPTVNVPPQRRQLFRSRLREHLGDVFERAGKLAVEYRGHERDPRQVTAELTALLPEAQAIKGHLDRLGWFDNADDSEPVALRSDAVLTRAMQGYGVED